MHIKAFATALAKQIQREVPRGRLKTEAEFERRHVVRPAWKLSKRHPEVRVYVHPQKRKKKCDDCDSKEREPNRVKGCPRCWAASKKWSVVDVLGTRNNFDLVARDRNKRSLAVEVKWLSLSPGRGPNSEFQRFIGQCVLAAAVHEAVIGVCGFRGKRDRVFEQHEAKVRGALKKIGVVLIALRTKNKRARERYAG